MNYRAIWSETFGPIIEGFHVHHITPRSEGGKDVIGNLIALHPDDHFLIHKMRGDKWCNNVWSMRNGHSDVSKSKISKSLEGNSRVLGKTWEYSDQQRSLRSKSLLGNRNGVSNTVYKFSHEEHGEEICTRYELLKKHGVDTRRLFVKTNPQKTTSGWKVEGF